MQNSAVAVVDTQWRKDQPPPPMTSSRWAAAAWIVMNTLHETADLMEEAGGTKETNVNPNLGLGVGFVRALRGTE
jgi:hypothetical protein